MTTIASPFPQFFDLNGAPLTGGKLYFGQPNQHPISSPIEAYWDAAFTQPAAQPVATVAGYPVRAGTPALLYVNGDFSMLALDAKGQQLFYARTSLETSAASLLRSELADDTVTTGAGLVGFKADLNYAVGTLGQAVQDRSYSITDQPWNCVSGTDCGAAIQAASDWLASVGGGTLIFPVGEWQYSTALTLAANILWRGTSRYGSVLKALNDTSASITCSNARGGIESLTIRGPHSSRAARIAAPATCIGIIDRSANATFKEVRVEFFKKGWSKTIGYWCNYFDLWIENNGIGWSWDNTGADYCNLLTFNGCTFRGNDRNGIASTAVTNNSVITYIGCDVETNCGEDPLIYPQIALGNARAVTWLGGYAEANGISPAPDFWDFQNTSIVTVRNLYLSGCRKAFFSGSNGSGTVTIDNVYWAGGTSLVTSHAYDFPSCVNITVYDRNTHTAAIVLDGSGSQRIASGDQLATRTSAASFTPVLSGATTAGTFGYANQTGRWTRNGNVVTYAGRITLSAITVAPTGALQISLPVASVNAANIRFFCTLDCTTVTASGANTYFYGRIEPNTSQMTLYQGGSGTPLALAAANIAATSQILWSISYEV